MIRPTDRTDLEPLFGLRLRTDRLELRLGSAEEVEQLGRLAEHGVHEPDEMPFAVAWTDAVGTDGFLDGFVAYHRSVLDAWSPDDWTLNLLVWANRTLVGTQSLLGKRFTQTRVVATGSWLGRAFQRRGIGTEMRAAVLHLAFRGLGAVAATSAWLEGSEGSRRVSGKLGYRETGVATRSPRGEPVAAHEVALERAAFRSPVRVRIDGLEPCLPLFGAVNAIGRAPS